MSKRTLVIAAIAVIAVAVFVGYALLTREGDRPSSSSPPVQVVEALLELRAEGSTDTTAYARYFESTSVAEVLSQDAVTQKGKRLVPEWKNIEVTDSAENTATVVVTWKSSSEFESWPATTAFLLKKSSGSWVVIDASVGASAESSSAP